jgi:Flp pilus assembly protein TadD
VLHVLNGLVPQNPQNVFLLQQLSKTFECLRDYSAARTTLERALNLSPKDQTSRVQLAMLDLAEKADSRPLRSTLETLNSEDPAAIRTFASEWLLVGLYDRDLHAAARGLSTLGAEGCFVEAAPFPRSWCEGQVATLKGDQNDANRSFNEARLEVERVVITQPENGPALSVLGVVDAALGRGEQGVREGRRALELLPLNKDSINGALLMRNLALIYTLTGQSEAAIDELEKVTKVPGYLSYGELKLDPLWEPLRSDSRFTKMIGSLSSK